MKLSLGGTDAKGPRPFVLKMSPHGNIPSHTQLSLLYSSLTHWEKAWDVEGWGPKASVNTFVSVGSGSEAPMSLRLSRHTSLKSVYSFLAMIFIV